MLSGSMLVHKCDLFAPLAADHYCLGAQEEQPDGTADHYSILLLLTCCHWWLLTMPCR